VVVETLRIKHVFADSAQPKHSGGTPMKTSEVARSPNNKIIAGDWDYWPDRDKNDPWSAWHNYKASIASTFCGATPTCSFFRFPKEASGWSYTGPAPDPNFTCGDAGATGSIYIQPMHRHDMARFVTSVRQAFLRSCTITWSSVRVRAEIVVTPYVIQQSIAAERFAGMRMK